MATTVLVTFYCRDGATETLAHAAAVGAVQARALIRLRRLPDVGTETNAAVRQMQKEYVAPREADVVAVDALVLVSPDDLDATAAEWAPYLDLLNRLGADGKLAGKVAAVIATGAAAQAFADVLRRAGLAVLLPETPVTGSDAAVALGRRVVAAVGSAQVKS